MTEDLRQDQIFDTHIDGSVELPDALVDLWLSLKRSKGKAAADFKHVNDQLLAAIGDAKAGHCSHGQFVILSKAGKKLDAAALEAALPDVVEKYKVETERECLTFTAVTPDGEIVS